MRGHRPGPCPGHSRRTRSIARATPVRRRANRQRPTLRRRLVAPDPSMTSNRAIFIVWVPPFVGSMSDKSVRGKGPTHTEWVPNSPPTRRWSRARPAAGVIDPAKLYEQRSPSHGRSPSSRSASSSVAARIVVVHTAGGSGRCYPAAGPGKSTRSTAIPTLVTASSITTSPEWSRRALAPGVSTTLGAPWEGGGVERGRGSRLVHRPPGTRTLSGGRQVALPRKRARSAA